MKQIHSIMNVIEKITICINTTRLNIVKNASYFLKNKNLRAVFSHLVSKGLTFRHWGAPQSSTSKLNIGFRGEIYQNMNSSQDSIFFFNQLFCH